MNLQEELQELEQLDSIQEETVAKKKAEIKIESNEETLTLSCDNSPFVLSLRCKSFAAEKQQEAFIRCVEKMVRYSNEYKYWHSYITHNLGFASCALTNESMNETKVEIHHHPISLYSICRSVVSAALNSQEEFCTFDIATRVIELHFKNKVGFVPLLSNLHEKYHNGYLDIPIELIHGDYKHILKNYPMDEVEKDKVLALCQVNLKNSKEVSWAKNKYPGLSKDPTQDEEELL